MIRSLTGSCESSWCPTRRSRRTRPTYREALALINEARAGLFPTVNGVGSATRSSPSQTNLTAEASGTWTLDVWGQIRREIEAQQAFAQTSAAILANATLAAQSALALAYVTLQRGRIRSRTC